MLLKSIKPCLEPCFQGPKHWMLQICWGSHALFASKQAYDQTSSFPKLTSQQRGTYTECIKRFKVNSGPKRYLRCLRSYFNDNLKQEKGLTDHKSPKTDKIFPSPVPHCTGMLFCTTLRGCIINPCTSFWETKYPHTFLGALNFMLPCPTRHMKTLDADKPIELKQLR